jgi:DNA-binding GntR family transcriptional regulator
MNNDKSTFINNSKEIIYQSIRMDIISQKFKPGQLVTEDELAKKYNVSRTPIREIVRKLEYEELIKITNKRILIYEMTNKDIEEVLHIRMVLETAAARVATQCITDDQIKELEKIEENLDKAIKEEDSVLSFETDERLHDFILVTAGNMRVRKILYNLMGQILRIRYISGHKPGRIKTTGEEHKRIIHAIKKRDAFDAEEKMKAHFLSTRELLLPSQEMDVTFRKFLKGLKYNF